MIALNHLGTQVLETPRLLLRPFTLEDGPDMLRNWANDPRVTHYLTWPPHKDLSVTQSVLADWVGQYASPEYYQWAIVLKKEGNAPIGSIAVVHKNDDIGMFHMGYCIGVDWWHRGITSEALEIVLEFLFEQVGANRIESRHDTRNENSGRVMLHCGMRLEGIRRQGDRNNQGICDCADYAILREDWLERKSNTEKMAK